MFNFVCSNFMNQDWKTSRACFLVSCISRLGSTEMTYYNVHNNGNDVELRHFETLVGVNPFSIEVTTVDS